MNLDDESCVQQDEEVDQILELAVDYAVRRSYLPGLTKEKKKAVRKRASTLVVDKGEVFLKMTSEGCDRRWRAATNPRVMPFWSFVRDTSVRRKLSSTLHVYCSCRMPEQAGSTMIQCSTCKEWFRVGVCVDVPTQAFDSATKWFCNKCNY